ncbi:MAG: metallopeptidase family protein [Defluviitaleaceae bacterium]|nr:metallopeptidase family protein [Defluviitaleaceae bacterium]MCL2836417.1 metallopeptidase family protein [Defluviitaleaceae bacterium]
MISFDEIGDMLEEIACSLPPEFYKDLNGGVNLLPDIKMHPESVRPGDLFIMGQYHYEPRGLGRYITIFYGSFIQVFGHYGPRKQKEELRKILVHEFTHHLESLGGERHLEYRDEIEMEKYKRRRGRKD